jgi:hypothetical protein
MLDGSKVKVQPQWGYGGVVNVCGERQRSRRAVLLDILGPLSPIWQARSLNGEVALARARPFASRARASISKKFGDAIIRCMPTPRRHVAIVLVERLLQDED